MLGATLLLGACSPDQITSSLELAVDAAIAAGPAVEAAAGVPADTQQIVGEYLDAAETCLSEAAAALDAAPARPSATAAQIAAVCSATLEKSPALPAGTPASVTAAVNAVATALAKFLGSVPMPSPAGLPPSGASSFFAAQAPVKVKVDRKRLTRIHSKLLALREKLHRSKPQTRLSVSFA